MDYQPPPEPLLPEYVQAFKEQSADTFRQTFPEYSDEMIEALGGPRRRRPPALAREVGAARRLPVLPQRELGDWVPGAISRNTVYLARPRRARAVAPALLSHLY